MDTKRAFTFPLLFFTRHAWWSWIQDFSSKKRITWGKHEPSWCFPCGWQYYFSVHPHVCPFTGNDKWSNKRDFLVLPSLSLEDVEDKEQPQGMKVRDERKKNFLGNQDKALRGLKRGSKNFLKILPKKKRKSFMRKLWVRALSSAPTHKFPSLSFEHRVMKTLSSSWFVRFFETSHEHSVFESWSLIDSGWRMINTFVGSLFSSLFYMPHKEVVKFVIEMRGR